MVRQGLFTKERKFMFILTRKQLYRAFDRAVDQVKHGTYRRLIQEYLETMNPEEAGLLAAAVTNCLFLLPPANQDGKAFLEKNAEKVRKAAQDIKKNEAVLEAVNLALHHRQKILFDLLSSGKSSGAAINAPLDNLKKLGLATEMKELPDVRKFLKYARKFLQKSPD